MREGKRLSQANCRVGNLRGRQNKRGCGMVSEVLNVKVDRLARLEGESKVKAFCDLIFGDLFVVKGFRVVESEKGFFVGMPQQQSKQGRWFNVFTPATNEIKEYLTEIVLAAYQAQA